jgi:hypothetical protein
MKQEAERSTPWPSNFAPEQPLATGLPGPRRLLGDVQRSGHRGYSLLGSGEPE